MDNLISPESRQLFPIQTIKSLDKLFRIEISKESEPNLALFSIILGSIENSLVSCTVDFEKGKISAKQHGRHRKILKAKRRAVDPDEGQTGDFPALEWNTVEALYLQFHSYIKSAVDWSVFSDNNEETCDLKSSPELITTVMNVIWNRLVKSYSAEKPHLQTLFTYLTGKKLDSFGFAYAVVAACQILKVNDVHLTLTEDHVWISYGPNGESNMEVTWHRKENKDRRGEIVGQREDHTAWLYLKNNGVRCNRYMELAACVAAINPGINASTDSEELGTIQLSLLWALYDAGHLDKYPLAIANLADLEEIRKTPGRYDCELLYEEAIKSSRIHYNDMHVYPHIYMGGYYYRKNDFKSALKCWANAAGVIRNYSYAKCDEEIYKEFMDMSTELIGNIMRESSCGICASSVTRDPESFAQLLKIFDGICEWEEGSKFPVVHIVWAKAWATAINKFDSSIRRRVTLLSSPQKTTDEEENNDAEKPVIAALAKACSDILILQPPPGSVDSSSSSDELLACNGVQLGAFPSFSGSESFLDLCNDSNSARPLSSPDSGIHEDDMPSVSVTLHSSKMQNVKELLTKEKFKIGDFILILTAQTTFGQTVHSLRSEDKKSRTRTRSGSSHEHLELIDSPNGLPTKRARIE